MDEKKEQRQMLLICAAMGVIVAVVIGWFLYQNRMEYWTMQARSTFRAALEEELQKWKDIDVYFSSSGSVRLPDDPIDIKKEPVKVSLESEHGKKDYWIPYEKYSRNIGWSSSKIRGMHSYLLYVSPLNADSLNLFWKNRLTEIGFSGTTAVRISVADWLEHETYTCSADSLYLSRSDSLFTYYLGCRCEVGMTGYLCHSWWMLLSWKDILLLGTLVICSILLFFVINYVSRIYRRLFVKEVPVVVEKEVPVVIKKEIPVIADSESRPHIYRLEDGVYFDAELRLLKRGDESVKLSPLLAKLLRGLLDAENYRLSNDEILCLLWSNGAGTLNNLHITVKRLRKYLSQISSYTIGSENYGYQLKKPHFFEENPR